MLIIEILQLVSLSALLGVCISILIDYYAK